MPVPLITADLMDGSQYQTGQPAICETVLKRRRPERFKGINLQPARVVSGLDLRRARRSLQSDLRETTINKQFRPGDVTAVVGREKYHCLSDLIACAEPAEWNSVGNSLYALLGLLYGMPRRCVGIAWAYRVDANAAIP